MDNIKYGFVDSNNLLVTILEFAEHDIGLVEHFKDIQGASACYLLSEPYGFAVVDSSLWTGSYFTPGCKYKKWAWSNATTSWEPPVPYPNDSKSYLWSDEENGWVKTI